MSGGGLSDSALAQLEKLANLKEAGVLSESEFGDAKRRILASEERPAPSADQSKRYIWAGAGAAALLLGGLAAYSLSSTSNEPGLSDNNEIGMNSAEPWVEAEDSFESLCGSDATYSTIKDIIFDKAVESYGPTPGPLNSLRKAVRLRMEVPATTKIDRELSRVDCSGRAVIELPPTVQEQFGGRSMISSEVVYSVQPAADKSGTIVSVSGAGEMIASLVAAANLASASQIAAAGGPQLQRTFNPSFDCGRRLTNVERMICQSESLASLDRALSDRYFEIKPNVSRAEWQIILQSQRDFLMERAKCADEACIRNAYISQSNRLDAMTDNSAM